MRLLAALLLPAALPVHAQIGGEPLQPEEAFALQADAEDAGTLRLEWTVADDYYLYRDKFRIQSDTPGITLGQPEIPAGKIKRDEFFGDIAILRGAVSVRVPLLRAADAPRTLTLKATAQGCWDGGICYPPYTHTVSLDLPPAAPAAAAEPSTPPLQELGELTRSLGLEAGGDDEFLDPDEAFILDTRVEADGTAVADWAIAPGYYLYRDKFTATVKGGEGIRAGTLELPPGEEKEDEFFGRIRVFHDRVEARLPLSRAGGGADTVELALGYQGCAEAGLCYPPIVKTVSLALPEGTPTAAAAATAAPVAAAAPPAAAAQPVSEQDRLAQSIASGGYLVTIALFFGAGLLLSMTPCVFPMIPILSSIIVGHGHKLTTRKAFTLSLVYVLAMAVTYTVAGVVAALLGENLQAAFQNPWVLGTFSAVFVLLALSMFGFYELQLPSALQSRISEVSNKQRGGSLTGVAVMGFLSALIVGPCVAPPLMGALIYIGQTGDALLGGTALFALSMGMGMPLLAIGTSAGKILPRAGAWMDTVKAVFGVLLLAVAVWMLERILPGQVTMLLWAGLAIVSAVYMGVLEPIPAESGGWRRLWKGLGAVLAAWGILLLVGASTGNTDPLEPLANLGRGGGIAQAGTAAPAHGLEFRRVKTATDLDAQVAAAAGRGQPVMLDFYADWCISCKEMEKYTFSDAGVQQALAGTLLLQADVTANDEEDKALLKRFSLLGPPSILFWGPDGVERPGYRVVGYLPADEFRLHVENATAP